MVSPNPGLLGALLNSGHLSGLIRWKVSLTKESIQSESSIARRAGYFLDSTSVKSLEDFLTLTGNQISQKNLNLTNLEQVLLDLPVGENGAVLAWSGWQEFLKESPTEAKGIASIFEAVANQANWVFLVVDPKGDFPDLAQLASA